MDWLLNKILKRLSPKKLAQLAWKAILPKLQKHVKSTENDFDDEALEILIAIVEGVIGDLK